MEGMSGARVASASCLPPTLFPGEEQDQGQLQNHSLSPPAAARALEKPPPKATPMAEPLRGHGARAELRQVHTECSETGSFHSRSPRDLTCKLAPVFRFTAPTSILRVPPASALHQFKQLPAAPTWDCSCTQLSLTDLKPGAQAPDPLQPAISRRHFSSCAVGCGGYLDFNPRTLNKMNSLPHATTQTMSPGQQHAT